MIRKWFVKDTDNPAGQDKTLGDYIERKEKVYSNENKLKKLTFDEWLQTPVPMDDGSDSEVQFFECTNKEIWLMKTAWEAGQENK